MSAIRTVCALLTVGKRFPAANVNCASHHPVIANIKNMYEEQNKAIKKKKRLQKKKIQVACHALFFLIRIVI